MPRRYQRHGGDPAPRALRVSRRPAGRPGPRSAPGRGRVPSWSSPARAERRRSFSARRRSAAVAISSAISSRQPLSRKNDSAAEKASAAHQLDEDVHLDQPEGRQHGDEQPDPAQRVLDRRAHVPHSVLRRRDLRRQVQPVRRASQWTPWNQTTAYPMVKVAAPSPPESSGGSPAARPATTSPATTPTAAADQRAHHPGRAELPGAEVVEEQTAPAGSPPASRRRRRSRRRRSEASSPRYAAATAQHADRPSPAMLTPSRSRQGKCTAPLGVIRRRGNSPLALLGHSLATGCGRLRPRPAAARRGARRACGGASYSRTTS